ncbi:MAG: nuclear transport factor 2 family protein [candidate division KSB1 bacterium]|nr:nuclear transport factor 2 family protein [candidate division KSB1 bacterium]MDZ7274652.1 nuclear transport factor 2 family protein [candidate division KSB1 bacterium]MDZ7285477.1 nuclear transport factor 2 family protein [candidate division KSB1 bacterium]MDZ7298509.1 nuclear transport factor 2 family protein [candidate division KSB1 bacterium]MDZ7306267.1 nuclear transport factor 2 family protein [candidate division KSB1 bacterium]
MSTNADTVRDIHAAFGRGDIPAILAKLDDDVEWEYGTTPHEVPWLAPRRGRNGAAEFFQSLGEIEFHHFVPGRFWRARAWSLR